MLNPLTRQDLTPGGATRQEYNTERLLIVTIRSMPTNNNYRANYNQIAWGKGKGKPEKTAQKPTSEGKNGTNQQVKQTKHQS